MTIEQYRLWVVQRMEHFTNKISKAQTMGDVFGALLAIEAIARKAIDTIQREKEVFK